jgi:hypothetical protein
MLASSDLCWEKVILPDWKRMFAKIFLQGGGNFGTKLEEIAKGRGQVAGIRWQVAGIRKTGGGNFECDYRGASIAIDS